MFSPFYCHYTICKDKKLTGSHSTVQLIHYLNTIPELEQNGEFHFSNKRSFPHFISISLLLAKHYNSWSDQDANTSLTNLLVIVTARPNNTSHLIEPILQQISKHLNWQLIGEDDEGDEDRKDEDRDDEDDNTSAFMKTSSAPFRHNDDEPEDHEDGDKDEE
ncbi:MAG: hypothetical protein J7578_16695 [Chitinophagaceae bacterium]|nr:hypothetical protein [Chitinophagaceae bacterium]